MRTEIAPPTPLRRADADRRESEEKRDLSMSSVAGACYVRRGDLIEHELDGECLIYDALTANTHRLNETAFSIWKACDGAHDARAIAEDLTERYDVAPEAASENVERFIGQLVALGLVVAAHESEGLPA